MMCLLPINTFVVSTTTFAVMPKTSAVIVVLVGGVGLGLFGRSGRLNSAVVQLVARKLDDIRAGKVDLAEGICAVRWLPRALSPNFYTNPTVEQTHRVLGFRV